MQPLFPRKYIKPRDPVTPCKVCGCRLSRIRFVKASWMTRFAEGVLPDFAWNLLSSRCRNCGDLGREEWKDAGYAQR